MKLDKLQKKILIFLLVLCFVSPIGILLPMFFNANDAWGEWSAQTVKELVGYIPEGLAKYSDLWKAPITDYSLSNSDKIVVHQSGYYIISGIFGATIVYIVMLIIARLITRNEK